MKKIKIRGYKSDEALFIWQLKFNTIRHINLRDYTAAQVAAWAPDSLDMAAWQKRLDVMNPFIAELDGHVVGFADLQDDGYIDHFFCHCDYQGMGVGRILMEHILDTGRERGISCLYSHVSITARAFYEHFGFRVIKEQQVAINDQVLTNFLMEQPIGS